MSLDIQDFKENNSFSLLNDLQREDITGNDEKGLYAELVDNAFDLKL